MAAHYDLLSRLRDEFGPPAGKADDRHRACASLASSVNSLIVSESSDQMRIPTRRSRCSQSLPTRRRLRRCAHSFPDNADWAVVGLLMSNATQTEDYARALGLGGRGIESKELARRAYDHKERVKKRLNRLLSAQSKGQIVRSYTRRKWHAVPTHARAGRTEEWIVSRSVADGGRGHE